MDRPDAETLTTFTEMLLKFIYEFPVACHRNRQRKQVRSTPRLLRTLHRLAAAWRECTVERITWRAMRMRYTRLRRERALDDRVLSYLIEILCRAEPQPEL